MGVPEVPEKMAPFLRPKRFKVARGGRGGAKSWTISRILLFLGSLSKLRILCTREIQKSIQDSVYRLLLDQIELMGMSDFYTHTNTEIRGRNGTLFIFSGLKDQSADGIKSFEGFDIAWIEEAQCISERSLDLLFPTIRKPGSEIWISYNPELTEDPIQKRFEESGETDNCIILDIGLDDNPWATKELLDERREAYAKDAIKADWIWGGHCKPAVVGAIYELQLLEMVTQHRFSSVPREKNAEVEVAFDIGGAGKGGDATALIVGQRVGKERRAIDCYQNNGQQLSHYVEWIRASYQPVRIILPHDARAVSLQTGKSIEDQIKAAFPLADVVVLTPALPVEQGINFAREHFSEVWIDKERGNPLYCALGRYHRHQDPRTLEFRLPVHDESSHFADCFRYWMQSDPPTKIVKAKPLPVNYSAMSNLY